MKQATSKLFLVISIVMLLSACGSGSSTSNSTPKNENLPEENSPSFTPEPNSVKSMNFSDVQGNAIANADVLITPQPQTATKKLKSESPQILPTPTVGTTDADGNLVIDGELAPGKYIIELELNGDVVSFSIEIKAENTIEEATITAPVIITESEGETGLTDLTADGIYFNISGIIFDENGPVEGVQIEISGGQTTNGAVVIGVSNDQGEYSIFANVSSDLTAVMSSATIRISKPDYLAVVIEDFDITAVNLIAGLNIQLSPVVDGNIVVYTEGFDSLVDGATCGSWTAENMFLSETNLWHEHQPGLNILNQAYIEELVNLAIGDTSAGQVPDPVSGKACWYGNNEQGTTSQGNFLGTLDEEESTNQNGGTSLTNNAGAIVSPLIDLRNEIAPISLSFSTWWEIESVNPNENGYDLLSIEYKELDAVSWTTLARLNPLSDPYDGDAVSRDPIPFSNTGYNNPPLWINQEPISLDDIAGSQVQLRFTFETVDELYNGFRGWLIDDIKIERSVGTFPLYVEPEMVDCDETPEECTAPTPVPEGECSDLLYSCSIEELDPATCDIVHEMCPISETEPLL